MILSGLMADQVLNSGSLFSISSVLSLARSRSLTDLFAFLSACKIHHREFVYDGLLKSLARAVLPHPVIAWVRRRGAASREPIWLRRDSAVGRTKDLGMACRDGLPRQIRKFHAGGWQVLFASIAELGAHRGVCYRMPFLDPEIAKLMSFCHPRFFVNQGVDKWILREATAGILPAPIARRTGGGIGDDLVHLGLVQRERGFVQELIRSSRTAQLGLTKPRLVVASFSTYWEDPQWIPWDLVNWLNLELWLRR